MGIELQEVLYSKRQWWVETGEALEVLKTLPDASVHMCVTSPPYFGLRKYEAGSKEIGKEELVEKYVENLIAIFREVRRVVRGDGIVWLNIGDSYLEDGNLAGVPWSVAKAMQADGWNLRSDNLWIKMSPMPQSQKGWRWERCRGKKKKAQAIRKDNYRGKAHGPKAGSFTDRWNTGEGKAEWEDCPGCDKCKDTDGFVLRKGSWRTTLAHEYLFMFSKNEEYYADGYGVRQQIAASTILRDRYTRVLDDDEEQYAVRHDHESISNPEEGANLRSYLIFQGENFKGDHYAVFPPDLPATCIKLGTSENGVCSKCGAPFARVMEKVGSHQTRGAGPNQKEEKMGKKISLGDNLQNNGCVSDYATLGWRPSCQCKTDKCPAVVLDVFSGSGTTGIACQRTCRRYIGIELNPEFAENSRVRLRTRGGKIIKAAPKEKKQGFGIL